MHDFGAACLAAGILHIKRPVEMKEKLAEQWIKEHFRCCDTMLLEARLGPLFWADAVRYSNLQYNRIPNKLNKHGQSPWKMLTGEDDRWDKWKVFGCDVLEHTPNNSLKIPGLPKGRKQIFIGFTEGHDGHMLFDPLTRQTHHGGNCHFIEDFTERQNALYFYDRRRALHKQGEVQPLFVDDFDPVKNVLEARNLFLDPSATNSVFQLNEKTADQATNSTTIEVNSIVENEAARLKQSYNDVLIRPLRLMPVGQAILFDDNNKAFLRAMEISNSPVTFLPDAKKGNSESAKRYRKYQNATTLNQAFQLGATPGDAKWDYCHGFISFPKNESQSKANVFNARLLSESFGMLHHSQRLDLNQVIENVYPPEIILKMIDDKIELRKYAEHTAAKVLNSSTVKIDFSLSHEPEDYYVAINTSESESWKHAMNCEIESMQRFGVFNRVDR